MEMEIETFVWVGTLSSLSFGIGLLFLAVFNFFKVRNKENDLQLEISLKSKIQERHRIAADLHDSVLGDLNALNIYLSIIYKEENGFKDKKYFPELKSGIENAIKNTRLVSNKLMPPLLEDHGLLAAVEDYCENLSVKTNAKFNVISHEEINFLYLISYELFFVIQEFTTNMVKYGGVSTCDILFRSSKKSIYIEIIDDGKSYDFKALSLISKGNGMKNIHSRLQSIDAELEQQTASTGNHFIIKIKK